MQRTSVFTWLPSGRVFDNQRFSNVSRREREDFFEQVDEWARNREDVRDGRSDQDQERENMEVDEIIMIVITSCPCVSVSSPPPDCDCEEKPTVVISVIS